MSHYSCIKHLLAKGMNRYGNDIRVEARIKTIRKRKFDSLPMGLFMYTCVKESASLGCWNAFDVEDVVTSARAEERFLKEFGEVLVLLQGVFVDHNGHLTGVDGRNSRTLGSRARVHRDKSGATSRERMIHKG